MRQNGGDQDSEWISISRVADLLQSGGSSFLAFSIAWLASSIIWWTVRGDWRLVVCCNYLESLRTASRFPATPLLSSIGVSRIIGRSLIALWCSIALKPDDPM